MIANLGSVVLLLHDLAHLRAEVELFNDFIRIPAARHLVDLSEFHLEEMYK